MTLAALAATLRGALGVAAKRDVSIAARHLRAARGFRAVGDDCAALPDGAGYLLLAAEGIWPRLVEEDPWFAGYCAILVNVADVYAMGGRPLAAVDVVWGASPESLDPIWEGMIAASETYGVPIVGGHTNARSPYAALAVAILGRARRLVSSFAARPGDVLLAAIDLRGQMHLEHPFWNASTGADPARLRADFELLPALAEEGLCDAGKDISMGGVAGTLLMLLEASGAGAALDLDAIPRPPGVPLDRWLLAFPSFGFLLSLRPERVEAVRAAFAARDLACAPVGAVDAGRRVVLRAGGAEHTLWDLASEPLTGFSGVDP